VPLRERALERQAQTVSDGALDQRRTLLPGIHPRDDREIAAQLTRERGER